MGKCARCKKETNVTIMSMFNTQVICMDCSDKEHKHSDYRKASDVDIQQIKKGVSMNNTPTAKKPAIEIFEYIRKRRGGKVNKVGVIFGTVQDEVIKVGWSKCNFQAKDKFDLAKGLELAYNRAVMNGIADKESLNGIPAPLCIRKQLRHFGGRCLLYFKGAKKLELPI